DELMEVLLRLVDLTPDEAAARFEGDAATALEELAATGQVTLVTPDPSTRAADAATGMPEPPVGVPNRDVERGPRYVPAEYADWFAAATGWRAVPAGSAGWTRPSANHDEIGSRLEAVRRYAANHGPFEVADLARRYGFDPAPQLGELQAQHVVTSGAFSPAKSGEEWCLVDNLRQLHRRSLAILREQIEPRDGAQFAAFLADWQGATLEPRRTGANGLRQVFAQLQGLALPMEVWEPDILTRRLSTYQSAWLDQLCASGEIVWLGSTSPGGGKGKVAFYFRDDVQLLLPPEGQPRQVSADAAKVREWLRTRGASFMQEVANGAGLGLPEVYDALWELVWAGEATNDTFDPVRSPRRPQRAAAPDAKPALAGLNRPRHWSYRRDFRRPGLPAGQGRWSLFFPGESASVEDQADAYARQLLARYGVVAREMALTEDGPVPWAAVYQTLKRLEALGQVRRGYFVRGLSGAQFALPDAVERLRQPREGQLLLNATDPANPYGALLPFEGEGRLTRLATNHLGLLDGRPTLAIEGQARDLRPLAESGALDALKLVPRLLDAPVRLRRVRKIEVETWDGQPVIGSAAQAALQELGFDKEPQRLVLRPSRL
ncbi:MAG TPA: hypothetical protein VFS62_00875, partial [Chloroflexota bacterium]|nr:hypothetical protein [Chloroflexota bacterium]